MKKFLSLLLVIAMLTSMTMGVGAATTMSNTSMGSAMTLNWGKSDYIYSDNMRSYIYKDYYFKFTVPYTGTFDFDVFAKCLREGIDDSICHFYLLNSSGGQIASMNKSILKDKTSVGTTYNWDIFSIDLSSGTYYIKYCQTNMGESMYSHAMQFNFTLNFKCSHVKTTTKTTVQPTCSSTGKQVTTCNDCGATVSTSTLSKLAHTTADTWVRTAEPTCTSTGKDVLYCTVCNEVAMTQTLDKLPHTYGDWTVDRETTCAKAGERSRVCSVCGGKDTEEIAQLEHTFGDWEVETAATCTAKGKETRTCSGCGKTETQTIAMLDHEYSDWEVETAATCTAKGKETRTCSGCGKTETQAVAMLDHDYGDWEVTTAATCTVKGKETRTCSGCGKTETQAVAMVDHTYGDWEVYDAATCTSTGTERHYCKSCNKYESRTLEKIDHDYEDYEVVTNATCTSKGLERGYCRRCGKTITEEIPMLDHEFGEWTVVTEATCTANGKKTATCSVCGKTETKSINKLDHDYGEAVVTVEPTCTSTGKQTHTCKVCGKTETETVAKTEHTVNEWTITKEATEKRSGTRKGTCVVCGKSVTENYEKQKYPGRDGFKPSRDYKDSFADVGNEKWFYSYIETAYEYGLANGMTQTKFSPDNKFTVAQALTVAANIHAAYYGNTVEAAKSGEQWYTPYVNYCVENGIITADQFTDYTKNITRGEMAIVFANILPEEEYETVRDGNATDMETGMESYDAVQKLYTAGIVSGDAKTGKYRPDDEIVRSEACVIFTRIAVSSYRAK